MPQTVTEEVLECIEKNEYNIKKSPKTPAQRAREYRARRKEFQAIFKMQNLPTKQSSTSNQPEYSYCEVNGDSLRHPNCNEKIFNPRPSTIADNIIKQEHDINHNSLVHYEPPLLNNSQEAALDKQQRFKQMTSKKSPKSAAERAREYRARQRATKIKKPPKSGAERVREYRARKMIAKLDAIEEHLSTNEWLTGVIPNEDVCVANQRLRGYFNHSNGSDNETVSDSGDMVEQDDVLQQKSPTRQNNAPALNKRRAKTSAERTREYRARKKLDKQHQRTTDATTNPLWDDFIFMLQQDSTQLVTVESAEEHGTRTVRVKSLDDNIETYSSGDTSGIIHYATKATNSNKRSWQLNNQQLKELLNVVYKHEVLYDWSHERHFDETYISDVWDEVGKHTGYEAKRCRLNWNAFCKTFLTFYNRRTLITGEKHDLHEEMMPFLPFIYKDLKAMKMEEDLIAEKKLQEAGNIPSKEPYITLINCIYEHKELYDENHPMYNDDNYTLNIWKEIGKQINCTVGSCKAKWMKTQAMFFKFYTNVTVATGKKHVLHDLLVRFVPYLLTFRDFLKNEMIAKDAAVSATSTSNLTTDVFQTHLANSFNNEEFVKTETSIIFPGVVEVKKEKFAWETNSNNSHSEKDEHVNGVKNEISMESSFPTTDSRRKLDRSSNFEKLVTSETSFDFPDVVEIKKENVDDETENGP